MCANFSDNRPADRPSNQPDQRELSRLVTKRMIQVFVQMVVIMAILLVSAGRLDWLWVWVYLGVSLGILFVNTLVLPRDLIAERGSPKEDTQPWDKLLSTLILFLTIGILAVIGLDERLDWSPELPVTVHIAGMTFIALGNLLFTWAMVSNRFFSTAVRLQFDRAQTVATGGPYRFVRHPGYFGMSVSLLATSLALGSLWGLIPAGITICLYIVRTALEDRMLRAELPGYAEYAQQTRYRLVPGIW